MSLLNNFILFFLFRPCLLFGQMTARHVNNSDNIVERFSSKTVISSFVTCERSINGREINNAPKVYRGVLRAFIIYRDFSCGAQSRSLCPIQRLDDHLRHTVRETMLIGPPRGVATRESARSSPKSALRFYPSPPLVGRFEDSWTRRG